MTDIDFDKVKYTYQREPINIDEAILEASDVLKGDLIDQIAKAEAKRFDNAVLDICQGIARVVFCGREVEINRRKLTQMLLKQVPKTPITKLSSATGWGAELFCPMCLTKVSDKSKYCDECGQKLDRGQEE